MEGSRLAKTRGNCKARNMRYKKEGEFGERAVRPSDSAGEDDDVH